MRRLLLVSALLFTADLARADSLDPAVQNDLVLTEVLENLSGPTGARFLPDGRLVVIQQRGEVLVYSSTYQLLTTQTIPIAFDGEQGLLGIAVDPMFNTSNRIYFYYSAMGSPETNRHRVAWATIDPNNNEIDVANRTVILENLYGPANHNGGGIEFGPDGYLYIGVGDTGCNCGCSPGTNDNNYFPTCLTNANGKILRIDRDGAIPASNPLVGMAQVTACGTALSCFNQNGPSVEADPMVTGAPREEIYLWGFRNPWRFSFDSMTGYLWIGDVGEITYEEITISTQAGEHHGWPYREGAHGQATSTCNTITPNAVGECKEPAFEYQHVNAASVTGGIFSNHSSWPAGWRGRYWFGDYNLRRIWTLEPNAARDGVNGGRTLIVIEASGPVHFFEGLDGAVYYVSIDDGRIHSIAPAAPVDPPDAGGFPDAAPQPDGDIIVMDAGIEADSGVVGFPDAEPGMDILIRDEAGVPADSGVAPANDAGGSGGNGNSSDGCKCNSTSTTHDASMLPALLIVALLMTRNRRRRS